MTIFSIHQSTSACRTPQNEMKKWKREPLLRRQFLNDAHNEMYVVDIFSLQIDIYFKGAKA